MQSESETESKKAFSDQHFRLGIFAADARHAKPSLLRTQNVSHTAIVLRSGYVRFSVGILVMDYSNVL
jgi:hypothetical protein